MPEAVMPTCTRPDGHLPPTAVAAVGLCKQYGEEAVFDGLDLRIPAGAVFALLGPNGEGRPPRWRSRPGSSPLTQATRTSAATIWPPTCGLCGPRPVSRHSGDLTIRCC